MGIHLLSRQTFAKFFLLFFGLFSLAAHAQVIYNGYAKVTGISGLTFNVSNPNESNHTFVNGERVVIMQMQDDVIGTNTTNVSTFGDLGASGIKNAGKWEIARISSQTRWFGTLTSLTFSTALTNTYNTAANAAVQVITLRALSTTAFTSTANITGLHDPVGRQR